MAQNWIEQALNGNSVRVPTKWEPVTAGDLLAGTVAERTRHTLTVVVEQATIGGEEIPAGEWRCVRLDRAGVLRKWDRRDEPAVGQKVAIQFLGTRGTAHGSLRKNYAAGVAGEWD